MVNQSVSADDGEAAIPPAVWAVAVAAAVLPFLADLPIDYDRLAPVAVLPALADTVTFAGQLIVGGVLSSTITRCVHVAVFPLPSVTVQVTKFVPSGKTAGALLVTDTTLQLSPVAGTPNTTLVAVQPAIV